MPASFFVGRAVVLLFFSFSRAGPYWRYSGDEDRRRALTLGSPLADHRAGRKGRSLRPDQSWPAILSEHASLDPLVPCGGLLALRICRYGFSGRITGPPRIACRDRRRLAEMRLAGGEVKTGAIHVWSLCVPNNAKRCSVIRSALARPLVWCRRKKNSFILRDIQCGDRGAFPRHRAYAWDEAGNACPGRSFKD